MQWQLMGEGLRNPTEDDDEGEREYDRDPASVIQRLSPAPLD
jgi:hypothetical protein